MKPIKGFAKPPFISFLLTSNVFVTTVSSNALCLYSFLNMRNQVSHLYRPTGKTLDLCINLHTCRWETGGENISEAEWQQAFYEFNLLLIPSRI
jgi:hypothetical protein